MTWDMGIHQRGDQGDTEEPFQRELWCRSGVTFSITGDRQFSGHGDKPMEKWRHKLMNKIKIDNPHRSTNRILLQRILPHSTLCKILFLFQTWFLHDFVPYFVHFFSEAMMLLAKWNPNETILHGLKGLPYRITWAKKPWILRWHCWRRGFCDLCTPRLRWPDPRIFTGIKESVDPGGPGGPVAEFVSRLGGFWVGMVVSNRKRYRLRDGGCHWICAQGHVYVFGFNGILWVYA